eukprot:c29105_g13_i1 orf=356-1066(+)
MLGMGREDFTEGKQVHASIVATGFEEDVVVGNALVNMYAKCSRLEGARCLFEKMSRRSVVSWNCMITAYVQHGRGEEAFRLFRQMQVEGVIPDKITFTSILSACATKGVLAEGKTIHACIVASGFESDDAVATALVNMYSKCGSLADARTTFDKMPDRNVVSWNVMIAAYAHHGQGENALSLFREMILAGAIPDRVTFVSTLSACASQGSLFEGKLVHDRILASRLLPDVALENAL